MDSVQMNGRRVKAALSAVYEVRARRAVRAAELLAGPFRAEAGGFRGHLAATARARGFARYDRRAGRVTVILRDGRAFSVDAWAACDVIECVHDAGGARLGDLTGAGLAAFADLDAGRLAPASVEPAPAPRPAWDAPADDRPPAGAVFNPLGWASGVFGMPSPPREWADFARTIQNDDSGYYARPGAWVVPPPVASRAGAGDAPEHEARPCLAGHPA